MFNNGDIVDNTYQILNEIGSGGMGVVYLAYHIRLEKYVVLKKIKGKHSNISMLRNEVDILKGLHHPYLPQVYDFIQYNYDIYTVIDYINGYDLNYYIVNNYQCAETQLIKWLKQLCEVLDYLHKQSPPILHTDIKPANIIITDKGNVCLIDFGISLSSDAVVKGFSKSYASPEQYEEVVQIMNGISNPNSIDERTDIYSLGATFYHLMTGAEPNVNNLRQPQLSMYDTGYSEALVSIIDKSMKRDISKRYSSAAQMLSAVNNIKKLDVRYKKYISIQVLSSILAGIMILSGAIMIISGNREAIKNEYNQKYSNFYDSYVSGNDDNAILFGNEILNYSEYSDFMEDSTKAQILHAIGDCFNDKNDIYNAQEYYKNAVEYADYTDESVTYYCDYAVSLVENNNIKQASEILDKLSKNNTDSSAVNFIKAEIAFQENNFDKSILLLNECTSSAKDKDTAYNAYLLLGDSYKKINDAKSAVSAYESAEKIKTEVFALRKLGAAYLALANECNITDSSNLIKAKNCYLKIYNNYYATVDDVINLAQSYRLLKDFSNSKTTLEKLANTYPNDYRIYMQLAFLCSDSGNAQITMYCEKAHNLLVKKGNKFNTDNSKDIEKLKSLYTYYCGSAW